MIYNTSAAIAWYVDLPWSDAARRLVADDPAPQAPDLIIAESANGFWQYIRAGRLSEENARTALDHLDAALTLVPANTFFARALGLAVQHDHPVYDCFFLALAENRKTALVTADRRLAQLAENAAVEVQSLP